MPEPDHHDPQAHAETAAEALVRLQAELDAARAESARLRELLEAAQAFGRLGTWTRDLTTGLLAWDRSLLRLWGLDPAADAGTRLGQLMAQVVDADRDRVIRHVTDSATRLGPHAMRFKVRTPQGLERRLHAQWEVKAGDDGLPQRIVGLIVDDSDTLSRSPMPSEIESQLALAVDTANVLIWRHDIAKGRLQWSTAGWRALGMVPRPEGLTLAEVRELIHPDDLARVQASAQQALASTEPVDLEARYRHSDGSWRTQLLRRMVLRDEHGVPVAFLGVALDITERRAEQRRAQAAITRFDTVTRAAGIGHWLNDVRRGRIDWSPECRAIHGLDDQDPVPSTRLWLERWVHPDDRPALLDGILNRLPKSGERGVDASFRIVRADGEVRNVMSHTRMEQDGEDRFVFGVLIDVTRQARSELALREAQERVELALRGAGIGTWEQDLDTREILWDDQMWRLRGRPPRAQPPDENELRAWIHPEDTEKWQAVYAAAEAGAILLDSEFRIVTPEGRTRWLASRSTVVGTPDGRRRRIGVNWDITDAREAESARRESELARRENLSKSKFLARMSHELRTPLNAVLGFTQLLLADETGLAPESVVRRQRLENVHAAGHHLLALINDVLTLSGAEGGELPMALKSVPLASTLDQVQTLLAPLLASPRITLRHGVADSLHVLADETRLRQVLLNLLGNAIKYNRPGGWVTVDATLQADRVRIRVADGGRGMDEDQLRHLFEPFNRLGAERTEVPGTGIGLAIVKALVARMGGTVSAESQRGAGSVFTVELPRGQAPVTVPAVQARLQAPSTDADLHKRPRRQLLYIEDNPVNALIIRELIGRRPDLQLEVADDGLSGVSQALALKPELVLLDMQLPDIDGLEVLRRLRAEPATASIPVLALSANAMPEDIEQALKAGCAGYWTKPLDFAAFLASLDSVLGPSEAS